MQGPGRALVLVLVPTAVAASCTTLVGIDKDYREVETSSSATVTSSTGMGGMSTGEGAGGTGGMSSTTGSGGMGGMSSTSSGQGGMGMGGAGGTSTGQGGMGGMGSTSSGQGGMGGMGSTSTGQGGMGGGPVCQPFSTESCYSGPPATMNVGNCAAGTRTCDAQGTGYGPCMGEVLPATESCLTPADEDCDGQTPPCPGAHAWSLRGGDAVAQTARAIAVDGTGSAFTGGQLYGSLSLGGPTLTSQGGADAFIVKTMADGTHGWSRSFGDGGYQEMRGVAVTGGGSPFITGAFSGTVDFGCGALISGGSNDVYLVALDQAGNCSWSQRFGNASAQYGTSVAVDPGTGAVAITGYFSGGINFGGNALTSSGSTDVFVARFDGAGGHLWSQRFGNASAQSGNAIVIDGAGAMIVGGQFDGNVDFGGGVLTNGGGTDGFVAKYSAAGVHAWSKRFGDGSNQYVLDVAVDGSGSVYLVGGFAGTIDLGGGPLTSAGASDVFVAKLDSSGNHVWSKRFGDGSDQWGYSIAVSSANRVAITGVLAGAADFGGGALTSAGGNDVFVAVLDAAAGHVWSKRFGDVADQTGYAIALDGASTLLAGSFNGSIDLGGGTLTSAGMEDVFVAKFLP